ncbi:hypothetical protein D3C78_1038140 [compost metagenome]
MVVMDMPHLQQRLQAVRTMRILDIRITRFLWSMLKHLGGKYLLRWKEGLLSRLSLAVVQIKVAGTVEAHPRAQDQEFQHQEPFLQEQKLTIQRHQAQVMC